MQNLPGNLLLHRREPQCVKERLGLRNRQRRHLADVSPVNPHTARLGPQPLPAAIRALRIPAILAQHHPHVQLVLLLFHLRKKTINARKAPLAAQQCLPRLLRQLAPRHVHRHAQLRRLLAQLRKPRPVLRSIPRIDRPIRQRQPLVRNHQVQVEVHRIPKSLAARAGAKRIVEAEQPRLRFLARSVAAFALECATEPVPLALRRLLAGLRGPHGQVFVRGARNLLKHHLARLAVSNLRRVHNPRAVVGTNDDPIQKHKHRQRKVQIQQRLRRRKLDDPALLVEPVETTPAQLRQPCLQRLRVRRIAPIHHRLALGGCLRRSPGSLRWLRRRLRARLRFRCRRRHRE